ncbi:MAG: hypothetical protein ACXAB4_12950 [Candidatus Hodarchaeales archaeon]
MGTIEKSLMQSPSEKKILYMYSMAINDYLKNNSHRIASHTHSRTDGPLASRSDFKEIIPLIKGDSPKVNVLSLDGSSTPSITTSVYNEELIGHIAADESFVQGLETAKGTEFEKKRFLFITNGIIFPELIESTADSEIPIDFIEVRFDPIKIHRVDNPKIYLRNVISKMRRLGKDFKPSSHSCECGTEYLEGKYIISFWEKEKEFNYYVCPSCGIQAEDPGNGQIISSFVQGLN